jgi:hypothetical protein
MMLRVLLKLCVLEPQLLMAHVKSYSDLMVEGLQQAIAIWRLRLLMSALSITCLILGLLSLLMSLLLWAALPALNDQNSWVMWFLPCVLFVFSWLLMLVAKSYKIEPLFNDIQDQLNLDLLAICQASKK